MMIKKDNFTVNAIDVINLIIVKKKKKRKKNTMDFTVKHGQLLFANLKFIFMQ